MRKLLKSFVSLGVAIILPAAAWAQQAESAPMPAQGIDQEGPLSIKPSVGVMFGDNVYQTAGTIDGARWRSELDFPLNVAVAGVDAAVRWGSDMYYQQCVLGARVMGNLSDPVSKMTDKDWSPDPILVSSTESDANLSALLIDAYIKIPIYTGKGMFMAENMSFSMVGDYSHQDFSYDIYGLSGYYYTPGSPAQVQYEPGSTHAMTYDLTFDTICLGGEVTDSYGESFTFTGQLLGGLALYSDRDNHLIRSKLSTTDGVGVVIKVGGSSRYTFDAYSSGLVKWYMEGAADMTAISVTGTQSQTFYDNSYPGTYNVSEDVASIQVSGTVGFGCMF